MSLCENTDMIWNIYADGRFLASMKHRPLRRQIHLRPADVQKTQRLPGGEPARLTQRQHEGRAEQTKLVAVVRCRISKPQPDGKQLAAFYPDSRALRNAWKIPKGFHLSARRWPVQPDYAG